MLPTYAATGNADLYKVTMRKLEFCTNSTGVDSCDNAVVVGSGDKQVDICMHKVFLGLNCGRRAQFSVTVTLDVGFLLVVLRVSSS